MLGPKEKRGGGSVRYCAALAGISKSVRYCAALAGIVWNKLVLDTM